MPELSIWWWVPMRTVVVTLPMGERSARRRHCSPWTSSCRRHCSKRRCCGRGTRVSCTPSEQVRPLSWLILLASSFSHKLLTNTRTVLDLAKKCRETSPECLYTMENEFIWRSYAKIRIPKSPKLTLDLTLYMYSALQIISQAKQIVSQAKHACKHSLYACVGIHIWGAHCTTHCAVLCTPSLTHCILWCFGSGYSTDIYPQLHPKVHVSKEVKKLLSV